MHILIQPPSLYKSSFSYKISDDAETHDRSTRWISTMKWFCVHETMSPTRLTIVFIIHIENSVPKRPGRQEKACRPPQRMARLWTYDGRWLSLLWWLFEFKTLGSSNGCHLNKLCLCLFDWTYTLANKACRPAAKKKPAGPAGKACRPGPHLKAAAKGGPARPMQSRAGLAA